MKQLAIIIPAYKPDYIEKTLISINNQTNKNFTVYIGDDASPYELKHIVDKFNGSIDIVYHKFEDNLGGTSLTKQWERCVELSEEKFIWLFSDDDIMDPTAVDSFYKYQKLKPDSSLFKFFTKMIDENGNEIKLYFDKTNNEKDRILPQQFLDRRLGYDRFRSYIVEYIFDRKIFLENRFVDFPLAWSSDDATWIKYSLKNNGIDIIPDFVHWRYSGKNISSDNSNKDVIEKKLTAIEQYIVWLTTEIDGKLLVNRQLLASWVVNQVAHMFSDNDKLNRYLYSKYSDFFTKEEIEKALKKFYNKKKAEKIKKVIRLLIGK
ncbi:glycosyltransferase family A protein [Empedobacter sp. UBA5987]|uniref:glycosyltransferase family A protein n=1 Tax=Empedobacter sp. UBA5987 TaxID=1946444 RepID=UPI0025C08BD3|nr:glycosyltransferase family A protein [Empedobacter sp. UBA5987]